MSFYKTFGLSNESQELETLDADWRRLLWQGGWLMDRKRAQENEHKMEVWKRNDKFYALDFDDCRGKT